MSGDRRDRVDRLFERRPDARPLALAVGRFALVFVVGLLAILVVDVTVGVLPFAVYLLLVAVAGAYAYAGYRKAQGFED